MGGDETCQARAVSVRVPETASPVFGSPRCTTTMHQVGREPPRDKQNCARAARKHQNRSLAQVRIPSEIRRQSQGATPMGCEVPHLWAVKSAVLRRSSPFFTFSIAADRIVRKIHAKQPKTLPSIRRPFPFSWQWRLPFLHGGSGGD